jgi:hypothetical protein
MRTIPEKSSSLSRGKRPIFGIPTVLGKKIPALRQGG